MDLKFYNRVSITMHTITQTGFTTPAVKRYQRWGVPAHLSEVFEPQTIPQDQENSYTIRNPGFRRKAPGQVNQAVHLHDDFRIERLGQKVHVVQTKSQQQEIQNEKEEKIQDKIKQSEEVKEVKEALQALQTKAPLFPEPILKADEKQKTAEPHTDEGPPDYSTIPQNTQDADKWPDLKELSPKDLHDFQTMELQDMLNHFRVRRKDGQGHQFQIGRTTYNEEVNQRGVDSMYVQRYGDPRSKNYPKQPTTRTRRYTRKRTGSL